MKLAFHHQSIETIRTGTLVVAHFEGERPLLGEAGLVDWRLHGALSKLLLAGRLDGSFGSNLLLPANHLFADRVLIMGMGEPRKLVSRKLAELARMVHKKVTGLRESRFAVALPGSKPGWPTPVDVAGALASGLLAPLVKKNPFEEITIVGTPDMEVQLRSWAEEATKVLKTPWQIESHSG